MPFRRLCGWLVEIALAAFPCELGGLSKFAHHFFQSFRHAETHHSTCLLIIVCGLTTCPGLRRVLHRGQPGCDRMRVSTTSKRATAGVGQDSSHHLLHHIVRTILCHTMPIFAGLWTASAASSAPHPAVLLRPSRLQVESVPVSVETACRASRFVRQSEKCEMDFEAFVGDRAGCAQRSHQRPRASRGRGQV